MSVWELKAYDTEMREDREREYTRSARTAEPLGADTAGPVLRQRPRHRLPGAPALRQATEDAPAQ